MKEEQNMRLVSFFCSVYFVTWKGNQRCGQKVLCCDDGGLPVMEPVMCDHCLGHTECGPWRLIVFSSEAVIAKGVHLASRRRWICFAGAYQRADVADRSCQERHA